MKKYNLHLLSLTVLFVLLVSCNGDGEKKNYIYHLDQGEIFATGYHIKYAYNKNLKEEILAEFDRFNLSLNPFMENSIITKVNNNEPVELDSMFMKVFRKSMEVSKKSGGKFDITVSPLINAWGFGFNNMDSVTPDIIDSLMEFVGYRKIDIDQHGQIIKSDPRITINMSAIAKGYACDVIADLLERHGIENYMVEIGGEITARGVNEKGTCWRIGVDKPIDDQMGIQHDLQTVLSICDKSLATSGNYRNFYVKDGKKFAHTIDPLSGYPSEQDILGATVIADDCMTADAYATAFMAMGLEKSKELAKNIPDLHYYFIYAKDDDTFGIVYSDGFDQFFAQ